MRDLKKDKEISDMVLPIKPRTPSDFKFMEDAVFYVEAREGWPHAIERAIAAEAKVERLRKAALGVMDKWPDGGDRLENALWELGRELEGE